MFVLVLIIICLRVSLNGQTEFRVANMFSSGMVLQREPNSPSVWGLAAQGSRVAIDITLNNETEFITENVVVGPDGVWRINLGMWPAGAGYSLHVINFLSDGTSQVVTLADVAFGDVWLCSGQSNMEWTVAGVRDAQAEIEAGALYQDIRLLRISNIFSTSPVEEVLGFDSQQWVRPSVQYLTAPSFSAICLFYGEQLYDELEVPIGLIDSSWGGTIIEAWSPPEVIQDCGVEDEGINEDANHNNYLWNSMIYPLRRMSMKGVIWYQVSDDNQD